MKIFGIRSDSNRKAKNLAYLLYYESDKSFYIELPDDADEWEVPLILSSYLKRGKRTVDAYYSKIWVQQRIVPPDRQNLGQILKENNLDLYDEFEFLMLSKGRCVQDDYYLHPLTSEELPDELKMRFGKKIEDIVPLTDGKILAFFRNGKIKKCDITEFIKKANCVMLLSNPDIFNTVEVMTDGYGISWGTVLNISNESLYDIGETINLNIEDFKCYVSHRVINTAEASDILECSRQNVNDLIKRGRLTPIKKSEKSTLFLKNDVVQRKWK